MSSFVHEWIINVGIFLVIATMLYALQAAIRLGRVWISANVKNPAVKTALDTLLKLAETLVQASADRVRFEKSRGSWDEHVAKEIREGVAQDLRVLGNEQIKAMEAAGHLTPESIDRFIHKLIEAKVELGRKDNQIPSSVVVPVAVQPLELKP